MSLSSGCLSPLGAGVAGQPAQLLAAEILGGRRLGNRVEAATLMFFDLDNRALLRTRQNPLTMEQARNCAVPVPLARLHVPRASQSRCSAWPPTPE